MPFDFNLVFGVENIVAESINLVVGDRYQIV